MWAYNSAKGKCTRFFWGGCGGNENRFRSEEQCQEACNDPRSVVLEQVDKREKRPEVRESRIKEQVLPPAPPKCFMGKDHVFNLGDVVRFPEDKCQTCKCSVPPNLSCYQKACPLKAFISPPGTICKPIFDEDGCCQVGMSCVSADPPVQEPEPEVTLVNCDGVPCPLLAFIAPEDQVCSKVMDPSGCCQIGQDCQPKAVNCDRVPCPLMAFITPKGKVCTKVMDPSGCCQIGQDCKADCTKVPCPLLAFIEPEGQVCSKVMDSDGCCQVGLECEPERTEDEI